MRLSLLTKEEKSYKIYGNSDNDRGALHQEYRMTDGLRRIMGSGKGVGAEGGRAMTVLVTRKISVLLSQFLRRAILIRGVRED